MLARLVISAIIAASLSTGCRDAVAQPYPDPVHIGPTGGSSGGSVGRIVAAPGRPNQMFLVDRRRISKSTDSGHSWFDVTPDSLEYSDENRLHISNQNPDLMTLSGRSQTYYISTDAGESWESHDVSYTYSGYYFSHIAYVDPDDPSLILAYESGWEWSHLIRSLDGGTTWDADFVEQGWRLWYLWINPVNTSMMIAGTGEDFLSLDGGRSWSVFTTETENSYFYSFDPNDSRIFYTRTRDGTFRSQDSGGTWSRIGRLPGGLEFKSITVAPGWSDHLYGVTDEDSDTIYTSYDGGVSWTELWRIQTDRTIESISVPESDPDYPFVSVRQSGLYQFTEFDSWVARNRGLNLTEIESLVTISADRLLISAAGLGSLITNDGGASWDAPFASFNSVYQGKKNPQVILTHEVGGILGISTDGMLSWRYHWFPFNTPRTMAVSGDANTIYASIPRVQEGDDIVRSINGGATWQELGQLVAPWVSGIWRGMYKIEIHPEDSNILFARAEVSDQQDLKMHTAIIKSADGGVSWSIVERDLADFWVSSADPDRMYYQVDLDRSFHSSTDGGMTWQEMENLPGMPKVRAFASHTEDPDLLFLSTYDDRILLSRDNAVTWSELAGRAANASLSGYNSLSIPFDDPTILYAGTDGDGVLKFDISSDVSTGVVTAAAHEMSQAFDLFPNPTRHSAELRLELPDTQRVTIEIYDILGRWLFTVFDGFAFAGVHRHEVAFNRLAAGTYYVRVETEARAETRIVALVK